MDVSLVGGSMATAGVWFVELVVVGDLVVLGLATFLLLSFDVCLVLL